MTAKSAGKVLGTHLRSVIRALPASQVQLADYQELAEHMDPTELYDWSLYVRITHDIAARLPSNALVAVGRSLVLNAKHLFVEQGFSDLDQIFADARRIFSANTSDVPDEDVIRTLAFEPGHVQLSASAAHVPELIEGYSRGMVEAFGSGLVHSFTARLNDDPNTRGYVYAMRYQP